MSYLSYLSTPHKILRQLHGARVHQVHAQKLHKCLGYSRGGEYHGTVLQHLKHYDRQIGHCSALSNLSIERVVYHLIATKPFSGVDPGYFQSVLPSLKNSVSHSIHGFDTITHLIDVDVVGLCVVADLIIPEPLHGDQGSVVPLTPLLPGRVQERHRGHPDDVLLRLQQRVLEVFLLQVMELYSWILPGEIHKLLSLEYSINFVNEEDPGDVNINLNSYFVINILIQWRGLFVLQMCTLVMCDDHIY